MEKLLGCPFSYCFLLGPSGILQESLRVSLRGSLRGVLQECLNESFREPWFLTEVPLRILQTSLRYFFIESSLRNTLEDLLEVPPRESLKEGSFRSSSKSLLEESLRGLL